MITPSRWMGRSVEGISDDWIDKMLKRHDIKEMVDFENSDVCFPSLSQPIMGGVNYFHIEKNYDGLCHYTFVNKKNEFNRSNYHYFSLLLQLSLMVSTISY